MNNIRPIEWKKDRTNRVFIILMAAVLMIALGLGVVDARSSGAPVSKPGLSNVRDYAGAVDHRHYAIDGGVLFVGGPNGWVEVPTPDGIIVGAVTLDRKNPEALYIGAANALAIYRSAESGENWLLVSLSEEYIGGVTDLVVDSVQRLVYVGTDTAGLFRLREVGSTLVVDGHLFLDKPVIEVAADNMGAGLAFARTRDALYRAENDGLSWVRVENLGSPPTALAIADSNPPTIYVGTVDRGLVKSQDGLTWTTANEGLGFVPGSRLLIDALAVDPQQPDVLYVGTSYLYGSAELHQSPVGVAMSTDGAQSWIMLHEERTVAMAGLLPVSGETGAVYAVSNVSRTPVALGKAPALAAQTAETAVSEVNLASSWTSILAWIVAALAALALVFSITSDQRQRRLATQPLVIRPANRD
jgi:hypothetical protein